MTAKKTLLSVLAVVILCAVCITGTLAYLTKTSGAVTNTFTYGGGLNDLGLYEHEATEEDGVYTLSDTETTTSNNYDTIYPGVDIPKDPQVSLTGSGNTSGYLFIEKVEGEGFDTALQYTVDTANWTETTLVGQHGGTVYVYALNGGKVTKLDAPVHILANDKITVAANADLTNVNGDTLTFYAYLLQASGFGTAADSWNAVFPTTPTP